MDAPPDLATLENGFAAANTKEAYVAVRDEARRWPVVSGVEGFHVARIAADCGYWIATAFTPSPDSAAAADFITDLARAAELLQVEASTLPRPLVEMFTNLVDSASRMTIAGTREGWQDPSRWARITVAMESTIPVDFSFSPSTSGQKSQTHTMLAAGGLAALSLINGSADQGTQRTTFSLDRLMSLGDPLAYQEAAQDYYTLFNLCRSARPALIPALLGLQSTIASHVEQWRGRLRTRAGRLFVAQLFSTLQDRFLCDLADLEILQLGLPAGAAALSPNDDLSQLLFGAAERNRSCLLLDQMSASFQPFADSAQGAAAIAREREILTVPVDVGRRNDAISVEVRLVSQLPSVTWIEPRASTGANDEYKAKIREIAALEAVFAAADAGLSGFGKRAELAEVQSALSLGEVFVTYAIPRETLHPARRVFVIAVTSDRIRHTVVDLASLKQVMGFRSGFTGSISLNGAEPVESSPLGDLVALTRLAIQQNDVDYAKGRLRLLHTLLVEPLQTLGIFPAEGSHWFICPSGPLHALPFAALIDDAGRHLGQCVALSYVPSASVWLAMRAGWTDLSHFAGFANPSLDRHQWPDLPKSETEISAAASRLATLSSHLHSGLAATVTALRVEAPITSILHVATHGDFPEADVIDLHQLWLSPESSGDGRVTAEMVRGLALRSTRLAVLSVCDGGLLRIGPGDELHGLLPACLCAGVKNVLTTLWPVSDGMTAVWMRAFYKSLLTAGPAKASQLACTELIADGAALRDWAPFLLLGATSHPR